MSKLPVTTDKTGRAADGKFIAGNAAARGNSEAQRIARLRDGMLRSVTVSELRKATKALIQKAIEGDAKSYKVLTDRLFGTPLPLDVLERLEKLEANMYWRHEND